MKKHGLFYVFCICLFCTFYSCHNGKKSKQATNSTSVNEHLSKDSVQQNTIVDSFFLKIKDDGNTIIPGTSIGNLKVNERTDRIRIGKPQESDAGMCKSFGRWFYGDSAIAKKELDIFSQCDGKDNMIPHVLWIRTTDPAFHTISGIHVGSAFKEVGKAFSSLISKADFTGKDGVPMKILSSEKEGIAFEITAQNEEIAPDDTCRAIIVFRKDKGFPVMYFPFYKNLKIAE